MNGTVVMILGVIGLILLLNLPKWLIQRRPVRRTKAEVAEFIEGLMGNTAGPCEWDDFVSTPIVDPYLEGIRKRCKKLPKEFCSKKWSGYCDEKGLEVLRAYIQELRQSE